MTKSIHVQDSRVYKTIDNHTAVPAHTVIASVEWINQYLGFEFICVESVTAHTVEYSMCLLTNSRAKLHWTTRITDPDQYLEHAIMPFVQVYLDTVDTDSCYVDCGADHVYDDPKYGTVIIDWDDFIFIKNESERIKLKRFRQQLINQASNLTQAVRVWELVKHLRRTRANRTEYNK